MGRGRRADRQTETCSSITCPFYKTGWQFPKFFYRPCSKRILQFGQNSAHLTHWHEGINKLGKVPTCFTKLVTLTQAYIITCNLYSVLVWVCVLQIMPRKNLVRVYIHLFLVFFSHHLVAVHQLYWSLYFLFLNGCCFQGDVSVRKHFRSLCACLLTIFLVVFFSMFAIIQFR